MTTLEILKRLRDIISNSADDARRNQDFCNELDYSRFTGEENAHTTDADLINAKVKRLERGGKR